MVLFLNTINFLFQIIIYLIGNGEKKYFFFTQQYCINFSIWTEGEGVTLSHMTEFTVTLKNNEIFCHNEIV